jgi:hypothetical protein
MLRKALQKGTEKAQKKSKATGGLGMKNNIKKAADTDSDEDDSGSDFEVETAFKATPHSKAAKNGLKSTPANAKNLNSSIGSTPGKSLKKVPPQQEQGDSDSSDDDEDDTPSTFFIDKKANGKDKKTPNKVQGTPKQAPNKGKGTPNPTPSKGGKKEVVPSDSDEDDSDDDERSNVQLTKKSPAVANKANGKINNQKDESSDDDDEMEVDEQKQVQQKSPAVKSPGADQSAKKRKRDSTSEQDQPPAKYGALGTPTAEKKEKPKYKLSSIKELCNFSADRFKNMPVQEGDIKPEIRKAMERRIRRQSLQSVFVEGHLGGSTRQDIQKLVGGDVQAVKWKHNIDSAVLYFKTQEDATKGVEKLNSLTVNGLRVKAKDEYPGEPQETFKVYSDFCKIKLPDIKKALPSANTVTQKKEYYVKEYTVAFPNKGQAQKAASAVFNTRVNGCIVLPHFISADDLNKSSSNELIDTPVKEKQPEQDEDSSDDDDDQEDAEEDSDDESDENDDTKDGGADEADSDDDDDTDSE